MRNLILYGTLALLSSSAFANANAASKLAVCAVPQNSNLTQSQFAALDYVDITSVGSLGETGLTTNVLTYDTWDTETAQKAKGITDAGSPELELARLPDDPGQMILMLGGAVGNVNNYAFRETRNDGTVRYNRGIITGPRFPGGRNEDFDLVIFTLGFNQAPVIVNPTGGGIVGNAPLMTVAPAVTGDAEVGETLTSDGGTFTGDAPLTFTNQWFAGGVAIPGATLPTYSPIAGDVGKVIAVRVTALNQNGSAMGMSDPTSAVIA